ncbi:MAG: tRNA uridine-5-carboxymethylaminomethyl(34) synthesis GTPase MnmE [Ignavibacteriaceae bacterium]|nr:tRNA uridine-5-carboxymethylaminomethyl(34) synthesis GTPase MnmE [Ignavibacteriaceae bacterium]
MPSKEDTITAIITPNGTGAVSLIRVSGTDAIEKVAGIFRGKQPLMNTNSHTIHYGKIVNKNNEVIDDVLVSIFKEPNSYTGENTVEISFHGNPLLAKKISESIYELNIRQAEPGEFTKRAFLNGKIDLSQAEAVMDLITSRTDVSLKGARNQLDGLLSSKVNSLRQSLIDTSSLVELELDFAEEDLEFVPNKTLIEKISLIIYELTLLITSFRFGKLAKDGINVALAGLPNAGKSSLLNYLVKEYRAIVSSIPGTTRDIIREEVSIDGILYTFFDTAGIRETVDEIEIEGVKRSRDTIKNSDLVVFISDTERGIDKKLLNEIVQLAGTSKVIKLINKIDLDFKTNSEADIYISAKTGQGIQSLFDLLRAKALNEAIFTEKSAIVTSVRHLNCLKRALSYLEDSRNAAMMNLSGEFISADLRNAENALSEIVGEISEDDVLNNIFMNFCIGK